MDAYAYGSAGWLTLQAVPLILAPNVIMGMSSPEMREVTALESYFGRCLGMTQIALAALTVLLTGSIPLTPSASSDLADPSDPKAPYAVPTLIVTLCYHSLTAFHSYAMYSSTYVTSYALGAVGSAIFAFMAIWCLLFGSEKGRISKRTGADKRTSGWPFKNEEASKRKGKKGL